MQHDELDIPRFAPRAAPAQSYRMHQRADDGGRRVMIIAGAVGGAALLLLVGGWSLLSRGNGAIPVVMADSRPIRVKPEVRGGLQVTGANDDILSPDGTKLPDALAAPAETPQTEQLRQMQQADLDRNKASIAAGSLLVPMPASPAATPAPAPPPPSVSAAPAPHLATAAPPVVNDAKPAEVVHAAPSKPAAAAIAEQPVKPIQHAATPTPPAESRPAEPEHAAAGKTAVQLAAVGSEEGARAFWHRLSARMPELLLGRKPALTRVERDGRTFWRVRVDGFADNAAADHFCEQVRTKGGGCSVAAF